LEDNVILGNRSCRFHYLSSLVEVSQGEVTGAFWKNYIKINVIVLYSYSAVCLDLLW